MEVDVEGSCHALLSGSPAGGVRAILIPRVFRIVRVFPISQVSLPFSRSMMNRIPVPGGQGEILLRDAQLFAGVPDEFADLRRGVGQGQPPECYRSGTL